VSALLNGNHEILKEGNRWGTNIDPTTTLTYADQCSLIEVLRIHHETVPHPLLGVTYSECVGMATIFLSFAYQSDHMELIDAIEHHMDANPHLPLHSTYFWFDTVVNNQWQALDKPFEWWATTFREAVEEIGYTLCFLSSWWIHAHTHTHTHLVQPHSLSLSQVAAHVCDTCVVPVRTLLQQQDLGDRAEWGPDPELLLHTQKEPR